MGAQISSQIIDNMAIDIKSYKENNLKRKDYLSYKNMPHEFRPFVMFVNSPNYKSSHVNTDRLGFRKTYSNQGKTIETSDLKKEKICNILMGGSTAFGMGASSDTNTISSCLSKDGIYCHNFGVRAATSQQEFLIFQNFKKFLPKVKNVFILTGVNDLALAAEENSFFYPEFGGVYSEDMRFNQFWSQYISFKSSRWIMGKNKFFFIIEHLINKFKIFKLLFSLLSYLLPTSKNYKKTKKFVNLSFEEKILNLRNIIANDINSWKAFSEKYKFKIIYILQPGICWSNKDLSEKEKFILENQRAVLGSNYYDKFMRKEAYNNHKIFLEGECKKNEIEFIDANNIFNNFPKNDELFLDLCHLTDKGNEYLAKYLKKYND